MERVVRMVRVVLLCAVQTACSDAPTTGLTAKRLGHTSELIGDYLYVFGGGHLDTIERAPVHADGSIDPFTRLTDVKLSSDRMVHTSAVIDGFVYLFGGAVGAAAASTSIDRAPINSDGSLGTFSPVSNRALATPRTAHASVVTDRFVYVMGGATDGPSVLDSVERAPIAADGSLGPFSLLPVRLRTGRRNFTATVFGNNLYVFGGSGASGALDSVEKAAIGPDGTLGTFETLSDVKLDRPELAHASVVLGDRIYLIGGLQGAAGPARDVATSSFASDGTVEAFTNSKSSLAVARASHSATVVRDYVYVLGGDGGTSILTSVERAHVGGDGALEAFENLSD